MSQINKVFILAAGLGTRLKPFTDKVAKPAIPFWGLPQILYPYYFSKDLGVKQMAFNTHHLKDTVHDALNNFDVHGTEFYEKQLLDSGGGLFNAQSFLEDEDHFMMINSDSLFIYENLDQIKKAIDDHIQKDRLATLFAIEKPGAGITYSGLWSNHQKQLLAAGTQDKLSATAHATAQNSSHFIGVSLFSKKIFTFYKKGPQNIIHDVLVPLCPKHPIYVEILEQFDWYEIGRTQDFINTHKQVNSLVQTSVYDANHFSSFYRTLAYFTPNQDPKLFTAQGLEAEILNSDIPK